MPTSRDIVGCSGKSSTHEPEIDVGEKSDGYIVPKKLANKAGCESLATERVEGRCPTKGSTGQAAATRTQSRGEVLYGLDRVREAARKSPRMRFTGLLHHLSVELLEESYYALKREAAPGVDGETWRDYEEHVHERLTELAKRVHEGRYRPKPARRVYIPKANGGQRPLGIVTLEDKIVQYGIVQILSAIYEQDFLGFSYGFRVGKSQHDALDALHVALMRKVNWVLDADIKGFFDTIDHEWMMRFVEHRIGDPRILTLIYRWLKAGVVEGGRRFSAKEGTPQGAVISPLLANIYLHYVLDIWVQKWRKSKARGEVYIVRYADDFVMGFQYEEDAKAFRIELEARLKQFGLVVSEEKTRLIEFGRYAAERRKRRGEGKPETFTFLGFTHYCGKSHATGNFMVWRKTDRKRFRQRLRAIKEGLRERLHEKISVVGQWLKSVMTGYMQYHAIPGNSHCLSAFRYQVAHLWYKMLRRRSQRHSLTWERFSPICDRWLPKVRILHPWPEERFYATHSR